MTNTATETLSGSYDPTTRRLTLAGKAEDGGRITYDLKISPDKKDLTGTMITSRGRGEVVLQYVP